MKHLNAATRFLLIIIGAAATATGIEAGLIAPEIWTQLAAGFTTGVGIAVMTAVVVSSTIRCRAR